MIETPKMLKMTGEPKPRAGAKLRAIKPDVTEAARVSDPVQSR